MITNQLANQCMILKPGISKMSHPRMYNEGSKKREEREGERRVDLVNLIDSIEYGKGR